MNAELIAPNTPAVIPRAICGSNDRPLVIGDISLPCYVLDDERRVLTVTGMSVGLSMARGGSMVRGVNRLGLFISRERIKPFVSKELEECIHSPIIFRTPSGQKGHGYRAEILVELCEAVLKARDAGVLQAQQQGIARRCDLLVRGLAKIGIIALVDEACGYQESRDRDALHKLLGAYLTEERLRWAKTFPNSFYEELYRLRGWVWPMRRGQRPQLVGYLTNRLVYDRLPPAVLEELQRRNPLSEETGRRRYKHHQFLTEDFGQPDLKNHMMQLLVVMRMSPDWEAFEKNMEIAFPTRGTPAEVIELMELERRRKAKRSGSA